MEIVLGVSMTPTTVRMALVEGEKADGVILEHDAFDVTATDGSATSIASDHVIAAILGTQEGAILAGHRLISTGVTWSDPAGAALLREALESRGIEDVLLVSELHAAAALAQVVGLAVGHDKTALMFIDRDTATLAIVETADGSVAKVLSQSLHVADPIAALTEMVTIVHAEESPPEGIFVVGSGVDATSVKSQLQDLVAMPVIAPIEPQLALPRGAAIASANAPRFDTSTIGLAYSQDPGDTVLHPAALTDGDTDILGGHDESTDADTVFDLDDLQADRKPFTVIGGALAAVFALGVTVLAITMTVSLRPTAADAVTAPASAVVSPATGSLQAAAPQSAPQRVPQPAPAPPSAAAAATARLMVPPAPPSHVIVHDAAPAPAAPAPLPVAPPPPLIPWLPPILQPAPYFIPPAQGPSWNPAPKKPPWGRGHGHGHGGGHHGD